MAKHKKNNIREFPITSIGEWPVEINHNAAARLEQYVRDIHKTRSNVGEFGAGLCTDAVQYNNPKTNEEDLSVSQSLIYVGAAISDLADAVRSLAEE